MAKNKHNNMTPSIQYFAALDIGSNSFHFVLARQIAEHVQIIHSEKYKVKLASGLDSDNYLDNAAIMRGIATLTSLCSATSQLSPENFRVVATYTLRKAKNINEFLTTAATVFPFDIEIISGHEEARLIYCGVNYHTESNKQRLVVDIGGGSTEFIIGKKDTIKTLASLTMGCVSFTKQFFNNDEITTQQFNLAIKAATVETKSIVKRFKKVDWQECIGTSGTIKAIYQVINHEQHIKKPITLEQVLAFKSQLIACGNVSQIQIPGLKSSRVGVICAGVSILIGLMNALDITSVDFCKYALREGVLFEQIENLASNNTRARTVQSLAHRFNTDHIQTERVTTMGDMFFSQLRTAWGLNKKIYHELLKAAMTLHEIGLDINPSGYHKHGQYILTYADLAGFNQEQQQALAWLVGNQRKNIAHLPNEQWHVLSPHLLTKLLVILRLSILLTQQRTQEEKVLQAIEGTNHSIALHFNSSWITQRPIIEAELIAEQEKLKVHKIDLIFQV